jgi:peptidyl-prolyl cis-trans isomerase D
MQKHNKYLVWTIWVATIAFIGAGFVGWGSYKYGSKASAIGEVGSVKISNERLNFTYQNLYERYRQIYQGQFDEAKAKEIGLLKQAFDSLASQAQLLNLAHRYGITVSDKELADYIASMKAFQNNGVFDKSIYRTYLQNRRLKSATFEAILADELTIQKLLDLLETGSVPFERATVAAALSIADKIAYKILSPEDMQVTIDDAQARKAWEASKSDYLTPKRYELSLLWTDTKTIDVTPEEIKEFYDKNSFNYVDSDGKALDFEAAKQLAERDLKIKKGKKQALLDYIALKKGNKQPQEHRTFDQNDPTLSAELWQAIAQSDVGTLLKPKPVGDRYVTVMIDKVVDPEPMPFEQAKPAVVTKLKQTEAARLLEEQAQKLLQNIDSETLTQSDWLRLKDAPVLFPLNQQESLQFLQKLFTSSGKKGIITLSSRVVVYKIVDQKMDNVDDNLTREVASETDSIKRRVFESALFRRLNEQYPVKAYVKGL